MTSLLYYSISSSSDLTNDEIDQRVKKDYEKISLFVKELSSNSKRKIKKIGFYIVFMFSISQPLTPYLYTMMVPLTPNDRLSFKDKI